MSAADRAIRASATIAVLGVAGIAAYISYWHAYEVISAHGESGVTARLEPATIDGLVYCSSMVVLYAARHQLRVPALARWLLALGIVATLAANLAHGWSHGPIGATVAAWPAASLVGSYELLLWLIRTASTNAPDRVSVPDREHAEADHYAAELRLVTTPAVGIPASADASDDHLIAAERARGPGWPTMSDACQFPGHSLTDHDAVVEQHADWGRVDEKVNAAAVAAYRASIDNGKPISERRLAAMFGKTSRRWARHRMAEAQQRPIPASGDTAATSSIRCRRVR
jgi:hypothetical protein